MRACDIAVALLVLVAILPMLLLIALLIKSTSRGPVIFCHSRIGLGGRVFPCFKFRSMAQHGDADFSAMLDGNPVHGAEWSSHRKIRRDPRVTPIGALLRKTSLDELPQFINVLRGEMSLVGPRPIVAAETHRYGRYFRHYCSVRPGITGMWQINGRSNVTYTRRVALDVLYIRNRSLRLNLHILGRTLPCVIQAEGTY